MHPFQGKGSHSLHTAAECSTAAAKATLGYIDKSEATTFAPIDHLTASYTFSDTRLPDFPSLIQACTRPCPA